MSVRTLAELEDHIDQELAWRRIELQALRLAISKAEADSPGAPLTRALARSGVALLYAHWEGFVKETCQGYVDYVARRRLRCDQLNDGLLRTVLHALSKKMHSGDDVATAALLDAVRRPNQVRVQMPKGTMVDTRSNLRFTVLEGILKNIGFSVEKFATKGNLIDKTLCDGHNLIAHGRDYYPAPATFPILQDEIVEMMEDLRDLVLSSARLRQYMV